MEVWEAICTRRSVRKFKKTPVPKELIIKVLEAANQAPSANNRQPWMFTVIDRDVIEKMQDLLAKSFDQRAKELSEEKYNQMLAALPIPVEAGQSKVDGLRTFFKSLGGAPLAIAVDIPKTDDPWRRMCNIQDAAAAMQNMLLAAWSEGLATCWMCGPLRNASFEIEKILKIPADRELIAFTPLGYADHSPKAPPKVGVQEKVRWLNSKAP
ncbi:MAG: nitroreductase family protein [Dethiobacteria bacterium]|nr:nitroreductase family protein [Bacillota bacterium]